MRNHLYIRPLRGVDPVDVAAAAAALDGGGKFYPNSILTLPSTRVMVVEEAISKRIISYQPQYLALVMGSFTPLPDATPFEISSSLHQLTAAAYTRCHLEGIGDIIMHSNEPRTLRFAKRHGFINAHGETLRLELR